MSSYDYSFGDSHSLRSFSDHDIRFEIPLNDESPDEDAPPRTRPGTMLVMRLLQEIRHSISSFRPSESLAMLASSFSLHSRLSLLDKLPANYSEEILEQKAEIDIVISGGGLKGYFMAGCAYVLMGQLARHKIGIARIAGASAGAWAGMFMLTGITCEHWIETYHACFEKPHQLIHETYSVIRKWLQPLLPPDAYKQCSGRLFISITVLTWLGPRNKIISEYTSNDDLMDCCFASSTIPYLTERQGLRKFRGEIVCDGGFTNNCPVFPDGVRRQLVFRLFEVEYPFRLLVHAKDTCIDALILRGGLLMARFLQGEKTDSIAWLEERSSKSSLSVRPNYLFRIGLVPFVVGGLIISRGSGLSTLFDTIKVYSLNNLPSTIIPFEEAGRYFTMAPWKYAIGTLIASLFDLLGSLNLLL